MPIGLQSVGTNAIHIPGRVATTAALAANTYSNGSAGVGATLTANANGALPAQDGVSLSVGDRLLVKDEGSGLKNGAYSVTSLGSAGTPWVLTRSSDFNSSTNIIPGTLVVITEGTTLADTEWELSTNAPITVGTTALTFVEFGGASTITGVLTPTRITVATGVNTIGDSWMLQDAGTGVIRVDTTKKLGSFNGSTVLIMEANSALLDVAAGLATLGYVYLDSTSAQLSHAANNSTIQIAAGLTSPTSISVSNSGQAILMGLGNSTSGIPFGFQFTGGNDTGLTAGTESLSYLFTPGTKSWATGDNLTATGQRSLAISRPTYTTAGASTYTNVVTLDIEGAPNITAPLVATNKYAIRVRADDVLFSGLVKAGSGPTTLTDATGKVLSAALNTVGTAQGGTGLTAFGGTNTILYTTAASTLSSIATANSGVLVTSGGGVPSIATDIPTAVTIGGSYVYRVGGTDVAVTDGGTGLSTFGGTNTILYTSSANTLTSIVTANNGVLITSGTGAPSISSTIPSATQDNITRTGTLVSGSTGAGFTLAVATSTVTGALPAANGGTLGTQGAMFTLMYVIGSWSPADSTTYYGGLGRNSPTTTATDQDMVFGYPFKIIGAVIGWSTNTVQGSGEASTMNLRNVTQATSTLIKTFTTQGTTAITDATNVTGLSISVAATDAFTLELVAANFATNPVTTFGVIQLICQLT